MASKKRVKKPKAKRCTMCGGPDHGLKGCSIEDKLRHDAAFAAQIAADDAEWAKDNPAPPVGTAYDPKEHSPDRLRAWGLGVSYEDVDKPILVLMARDYGSR